MINIQETNQAQYVYPVLIKKEKQGYFVSLLDFNQATQGETLYDALWNAKDAICILLSEYEVQNKAFPTPTDYESIDLRKGLFDFKSLVIVDYSRYKRFLQDL